MKINLTPAQKQLRAMEWNCSPVFSVALHNPAVRRLMDAYNHGHIITKEECLSQMIVTLAQDWSEIQQQNFDLAMRMPHILTQIDKPQL